MVLNDTSDESLKAVKKLPLTIVVIMDCDHRVRTPSPFPLLVAKAGRNLLNEEITPLLPTGIGEQYSQTISNLGQAALLRRCELPL